MNFYEILEVSPNASAEVIRAAYKSLMQRYHPDRNPGDAAIAERASLVVQAYAVLCDAGKRAAYDRSLQQPGIGRGEVPPPAARRPPARNTPPAGGKRRGYLFPLLVVAIVGGGLFAMGQKKRAAPHDTAQSAPAPLAGGEASPAASASGTGRSARREIPALLTNISVRLKNSAPAAGGERILSIPVLGVRVGTQDAENAIRHLDNTKALVGSRLQESLPDASYEDLIKVDGERYLAALILTVIGEATGTAPPAKKDAATPDAPAPAAADRYGAIEVLLPQSYSVR